LRWVQGIKGGETRGKKWFDTKGGEKPEVLTKWGWDGPKKRIQEQQSKHHRKTKETEGIESKHWVQMRGLRGEKFGETRAQRQPRKTKKKGPVKQE